MKKLLFLFSGLIIFLFQPLICSAQTNENFKNRSSDVRLQENGWIRILDNFATNEPMEELYKRLKLTPTDRDKGKIWKNLTVKIQFLKPCVAKTKEFQELSLTEKDALPIFSSSLLAFAKSKNDNEKVSIFREFDKYCEAHGIDSNKFMDELTTPYFRCDYRIKVFVTFYSSKGYEVETNGEIPIALKNDSYPNGRKIEMLPGENTYITFHIPDEADSWHVWVPR